MTVCADGKHYKSIGDSLREAAPSTPCDHRVIESCAFEKSGCTVIMWFHFERFGVEAVAERKRENGETFYPTVEPEMMDLDASESEARQEFSDLCRRIALMDRAGVDAECFSTAGQG